MESIERQINAASQGGFVN